VCVREREREMEEYIGGPISVTLCQAFLLELHVF
jgi:hypothetical protein